MSTNFQNKVAALVGRGAQKQNAQRFARNVEKAYRREVDRSAEVLETIEDQISDLESLEGVNLKANSGLDVSAATSYVTGMVELRMKADLAKLRLNTAQRLYIEDFGKYAAPATSVEAVQAEVEAEKVPRATRGSKAGK